MLRVPGVDFTPPDAAAHTAAMLQKGLTHTERIGFLKLFLVNTGVSLVRAAVFGLLRHAPLMISVTGAQAPAVLHALQAAVDAAMCDLVNRTVSRMTWRGLWSLPAAGGCLTAAICCAARAVAGSTLRRAATVRTALRGADALAPLLTTTTGSRAASRLDACGDGFAAVAAVGDG